MKKKFTIIIFIMGFIVFINAQGITNTLGGDTENNKFIIENNNSEAGLVVTGEGKVGIGYISPNYKLDVYGGTINVSNPSIDIALRVDDAEAIWYNGDYFSWGFGGNKNYFAYNVGIGTTSPSAKLHVISTTTNGADNTAKFEATSIGSNVSHIHYGTDGDWYIRSAASDGKVVIQDSGGNVGIGTNSPDAKLDIEGTVKVGVNGLMFSGITELTGNTAGSGNTTTLAYLSGYDVNNTRVLAYEIYWNSSHWKTNGRIGENTSCFLYSDHIEIAYDYESEYYNKPFRLVLMKVE
ncbi:hypothetical protein KKF86_00800 [bacterium]|nr:hypothetical protein [bacterium]